MESMRCKAIVREEMRKLGILYKSVELGEVNLKNDISKEKLHQFSEAIKEAGLELFVSNKIIVAGKIKEAVEQLVYFPDYLKRPNSSDFISKQVNYDYNYLSKIFSEIEGITIEKYIISRRIERVKEMLLCSGSSLSEIAYKLLFSSVAHLSNQFKKVTGMTPYNFRQREEANSGLSIIDL